MAEQTTTALPPVVDQQSWQTALDELRRREKAATRELDAIAAQRRRLPMVEMPDYTLIGENGPIRLADVFEGRSQLIVYNHMWDDGAEWQCGGCTSLTSQWDRLGFLDNYDARFVIVTNGPIEEALAYRDKVGNKMEWYSSSESSFGADVDAAPGQGFAVNVFIRDGDKVYRTWHTNGRGTEQLTLTFALDRHPAVGPPRGVAGLPGRLAEVARPTPAGSTPPTSQGFTAREHRHDRSPITSSPAPSPRRRPRSSRCSPTPPGTRTPNRATGFETPWIPHPISACRPDVRGEHVLDRPAETTWCTTWSPNSKQDRTIAWLPGELDDSGKHNPGGWFWRYDLSPNDDGTDVTLTYDWTGTPQEFLR